MSQHRNKIGKKKTQNHAGKIHHHINPKMTDITFFKVDGSCWTKVKKAAINFE